MAVFEENENDDPSMERCVRVRRRSSQRRINMFHFGIHGFRNARRSALDAEFDYGLPERVLTVDHPKHHCVRLEKMSWNGDRYGIAVRLGNEKQSTVRYFITVWYGDEELISINDEEASVDAESWLPLCTVDLGGRLDGVRGSDGDDFLCIFLNMAVTRETGMNITTREDAEVEKKEEERLLGMKRVEVKEDRRCEIAVKWLLWVVLSQMIKRYI